MERIQTDNAVWFITNASKENCSGTRVTLQLPDTTAFRPTRSLPRHPWSKGKVEKTILPLSRIILSAVIRLNHSRIAHKLKAFQDLCNETHSRGSPEKNRLFCLAGKIGLILCPTALRPHQEEVRKVTYDCLIPLTAALQRTLDVCRQNGLGKKFPAVISAGLFRSNKLAASHRLSLKKGK